MLLPSRKTQLLAYSFRSQYRLGWNLALPEEDLSNRRQMDGPVFCARNFREGECSCRAEKLKLPAYSFRSQYRLGWNLALPEEDRSNHRQTDGTILLV